MTESFRLYVLACTYAWRLQGGNRTTMTLNGDQQLAMLHTTVLLLSLSNSRGDALCIACL